MQVCCEDTQKGLYSLYSKVQHELCEIWTSPFRTGCSEDDAVSAARPPASVDMALDNLGAFSLVLA